MSGRFRSVNVSDWLLSESLGPRRQRLLDAPAPETLLMQVVWESYRAANEGLVSLRWQPSDDRPGYGRTVAEIPLSEVTFDQFFNGRSGYRAQFYLSSEEGVIFNRAVVDQLIPVIELAYQRQPIEIGSVLMVDSLRRSHAKMWIFQERSAFDEADPETLNLQRWVDSGLTRGRRAPLPAHLKLDLKGAFIHPQTGELFVDELKLERPCDLFTSGYS